MSTFQVGAEQYKKLPVLIGPDSCAGKTYIITGANNGLGLETARHLVASQADRVVMAVRNSKAGDKARIDIERTTGRKGVAQVWHLDLASHASVIEFANRASKELDRVDALVENAGVMLDRWTEADEGTETCMTVNVISTMLLAFLMLPKLVDTAARFRDAKPRLQIVSSALAFTVQKELEKGGQARIFEALNNPKTQDMDARYI